ncbi:MAG: hypothetical protein AUG49_20395 [Catenulispora sp. 13_1_20CM_3_70_7]|nr:MAG: hypothetical protein AUG49_20395 [Catenulispora sp. 13_1_20CM_3_70_7]
MQLLQRAAGIGAQFAGEPLPHSPVRLQRVGLAAVAEQREHQLAGQALVQRMLLRPRGQPGEQHPVPALPQLEVRQFALSGLPLLVQGRADVGQPRRVQRAERLPAPQAQRPLQQRYGVVTGIALVAAGAGPFEEPVEFVHVDAALVQLDRVAVRPARDRHPLDPGQCAAQ